MTQVIPSTWLGEALAWRLGASIGAPRSVTPPLQRLSSSWGRHRLLQQQEMVFSHAADMGRWSGVGLILAQHRRRWTTIKTARSQRPVKSQKSNTQPWPASVFSMLSRSISPNREIMVVWQTLFCSVFSVVQRQTAVTSCLESKQLLLFAFARETNGKHN